MLKKIRSWFSFILIFGLLVCSVAQAESPVEKMNSLANSMISALEKNKTRLQQSNVIYQIVQRVLVPNIDVDRMAGSVVGRNYWAQASAQERQTFIREFTKLVVATYSAALASYDGDRIHVQPVRSQGGNLVQVNSIIIRRNGQRIPISYNLVRTGDTWKIYDFNIENVSMVQSYRSQFSDVLASAGVKGLNQRLVAHNRGRA